MLVLLKHVHHPSPFYMRNWRIERTLTAQKEIHHELQWLFT